MNRSLIVLIIVVLAVFVLGGGVGIFFQTQKDAPLLKKAEEMEAAVKKLSSKVIASTVAYGEVTKIEGRNITLKYGEETLTIKIKDNAPIYSFAQNKEKIPVQQAAKFEDIKTADNLNIALKLLSDGSLESQSVIILPSFSTNTK